MEAKDIYTLYKEHPVITTDSRNCPFGSIFFALKGASFDGNAFASSALEKGCSYAVVDNPAIVPPHDSRYIVVDDVLTMYKKVAREHRRHFSIPVIGITGTNGKTTTKELVAAVLGEKYNVLCTEANYNNDVGVPQTLLRLSPEHTIAVVEMGASHPGDIDKLVRYVEPTCGLITNVGIAHLQGFGSFKGVMKTKGELYDFLKSHGCPAFLDLNNVYLRQMAADRELTDLFTYAVPGNTKAQISGEVDPDAVFLKFTWHIGQGASYSVQTHLVGAYNATNALAAVSIGLQFGVSPKQICHALENYVPQNNRSQLTITAKNKLIVDAYNANPTSMEAAICNFIGIKADRKIAILGDMKELGEASKAEHQRIVELLETSGLEQVWLVGEAFSAAKSRFLKFRNVADVKRLIAETKPEGCLILIKGSNSVHLFELPDIL